MKKESVYYHVTSLSHSPQREGRGARASQGNTSFPREVVFAYLVECLSARRIFCERLEKLWSDPLLQLPSICDIITQIPYDKLEYCERIG